MAYLYIILGAVIGAPLRYFLGGQIQERTGNDFPWGTLAVNISGCFLIGLVVTLGERQGWLSREARWLLVTGFLGSYTTFSAFSLETYTLGSVDAYARAAIYVVLSVCVGIAATWLGTALAR